MTTRLRTLVMIVLCACCLAGFAQLKPQELSWQLGEKALRGGDYEGLVDMWRPLLAQAEWTFPRAREEVALLVARGLRQALRFDEARETAGQVLDAHPNDGWTDRARTHLVAIALAQNDRTGLDRLLGTILDDEKRSPEQLAAFFTGVVAEMGTGIEVGQALTAFLQAHPGYPRIIIVRLAAARAYDAGGDPRAALALGTQLLAEAAGTPDRLAVTTFVVQQQLKLGDTDEADRAITALLLDCPSDKAAVALSVEYRKRIGDAWKREASVKPILLPALDNLTRTAQENEALLQSLVRDMPGAVYWIDRVLTPYLAAHPAHPGYAALQVARLRLFATINNQREVLDRAWPVYQEVAGTPAEAAVAVLWAQAAARLGYPRQAGDILGKVACYYPQDPALAGQALAYARQAGDAGSLGLLVRRMVGAKQITEPVVSTLAWLVTRAVNAGDLTTAASWVDVLNSCAPEHALAAKARKLLRTAKAK